MKVALGIVLLGIAAAAAVTGPDDFDGPSDVTFYLFTQGNPTSPEYITLGDDSTSPSFNGENPTRFLFHGKNSNYNAVTSLRDAYLATGNEYNVVLVDWSGVATLEEMTAMRTTLLVADYVGEVIGDLVARRGLSTDNVYIIGHSMGGQIAGVVGNRVGGGAAKEVVGLDPASETYDDNPLEDQLDASDAQFVQIIHTTGDGLGIEDPRGDADFYVNGGYAQAGCDGNKMCSHMRVIDFYVESVSSKNFVATKCDTYEHYLDGLCSQNEHTVMGEDTPTSISGTFYLNTNAQAPYGQGQTDL